jgi:hypothetical protein
MTMPLSRRRMLMQALFGTGLVGLRSLASGIPASVLKNPRSKLDSVGCASNANAQYVIFSSSGSGDPLNANVPKTFDFADISHSPDPTMAATSMTLGGKQYTAAAPWAALPQSVLDRTCFFHHGTYTVVHPDISKVLRLEDVTNPHEQLPSLLAKTLAPCLGTVQVEPISLGPLLTIDARPQPVLQPRALAALLASPTGALGRLQALRDADLDSLNALYKAEGNDAQKAFLDQYALSQQQARQISEDLLTTLQGIKDNTPASQVTAAVTLIRMNVTPAVGINIPFGGDNHVDTLLAGETTQTVAGVGTIANLMTQLAAANMQDRVTFMTLNVFGRTLTKSTNGRQHHGDHHCMVMIGKQFKGSVIGGLESVSGDYRAQSIDSGSGNGIAKDGGDVIFAETLAAAGKTLGVACGVTEAVLDANITGGKPIPAALAS